LECRQVRFRIAILQEFRYADRCEGGDDGGISLLSLLAVLPVTQPPQENPMIVEATAPIAIPWRRQIPDSPRSIERTCMALGLSM
jgi:hypothetical protein